METSPQNEAGASASADSLLPCDACRRRKVKCSKSEPCDRCVSTGLRCTRDIVRKKRGPKKGSGSVIAKLRDETQPALPHDLSLPPFDLSQLQQQMPFLNRTLSNDSPFGSQMTSPLTSPSNSQFGDSLGPVIEPLDVSRSVPLLQNEAESSDTIFHTAFAQAGIQLPVSWQTQASQLLQFQAPVSPTGYVSVNDLAQKIFQEAPAPLLPGLAPRSQPPTPSRTSTPLTKPTSLDAILTNGAPSPTTTSTSSPAPPHGPKCLYRSDSSNFQSEPRLQSLAAELGLSVYLMSQCIRQYFTHMYSIRPIIHEGSFLQRLNQPEELCNEEKILVLSLCATTVLHAAPQSDLPLEKKLQLGNRFVELCCYLRCSSDWTETSTLLSIQASYHMCVALFELKKPRAHHFYLREAIGMAIEQGLNVESTYAGMDEIQAICSRRTFALLFITERGLAILRNKSTQITRLPRLSTEYFDEQDAIVLAGFSALVNLFSVLDEKFVRLWSATCPGDVSAPYEPVDNVAAIQHSLNEMTFDKAAMTDIQKADVLITQQWLRLVFWQASMRQGFISYVAADPIFSSTYPITIAKDLCMALHDLTYDAILVHGMGIFEKLFEVAYTLMDALTIANYNWSESHELRYLFDVLSASPNSHNTYVKMLRTKIESEQSPRPRSPVVA
ncbi:hypothetical protein A1O1_00514 [Capronia coronata CBS 617.96]|uniref:Zn(2)-C6 fungal-type domain-containing protein n=1 Tax=Capronia coronata CBS 617.96 TaxID=1182541 RepID=W9YSA1_9EURO|nr:uncharacterized protein A1O1_00514 [Capronia coronata CBS 617.96]EXJ95393.1 hypothetical protein A1O1_00514 [Capronia coronata CBS 617.96]